MTYKVTECFNVIKNLWASPEYTDMVMSKKAYIKLLCFIHLVGDYEITGFGRVQNQKWKIDDEEKIIPTITDFDIIEQEVKAAYVEAKEENVLDFMRKLPKDQRNEWVLDWHSHVEMGTSPSGTDWNNYEEMQKARLGKQFPFMIVNKNKSITLKQYISKKKSPDINLSFEQMDMSEDDMLQIYNECKEKVENLCTKFVSAPKKKKKDTENGIGTWYQGSQWKTYDYYDTDYYYGGSYYPYSKNEDNELSKEELVCENCGAKLDPSNEDHVAWHLCDKCLEDYTVPVQDSK